MTDRERKMTPAEFLAELKGHRRSPAAAPASASTAVVDELAPAGDSLENNEAAELVSDSDSESTPAAPPLPKRGRSTPVEFAPDNEPQDVEFEAEPDEHAADDVAAEISEESGNGEEVPTAARAIPHLSELFQRVNVLLGGGGTYNTDQPFRPMAPESLDETRLTQEDVEKLILKYLLAKGSARGRAICAQIKLPFHIVDPILKQLKMEQLLAFKGAAEMGDYEFAITDYGRERARRYVEECTYCGAAPVALPDYLRAMAAQSIAKQEATEEDLHKAFSDLIISEKMFEKLGPAINSGRGMFLFGEPGNGKTSIAERVTRCFGSTIWIPRALGIDGDILRLFDPGIHEIVEEATSDSIFDLSGIDQRWVQIVRPTVIAGGELTMQELEVVQSQTTKICEAPLQLKSNCGTLVIDDFGRQTMPVDVLLNRWIVPLEKRYDFLNLPSGKKVQVPFDQLIIFSTNLEPKDLVDGAFLRRIPYKIEVPDPTEHEFRKLMELMAPKLGFQYDKVAIDYLIQTHYNEAKRPFRACHPRDLLLQVRNYCVYRRQPKKLSPEAFDFAVSNYFSVM